MKKKPNLPGGISLALLLAGTVGNASASTTVPQTALPGTCIPQFPVPLPVFGPAGPIPRVNTLGHRDITVMTAVDTQRTKKGGNHAEH